MTASTKPQADESRREGETDSDWKIRIKRVRREQTLDVLESLGFDVDDANEMQKDILFLRKLRVTSEQTQSRLWAAAITLFFTLLGAAGTIFIQSIPSIFPGHK